MAEPVPVPLRCGLARLTVVRHGESTANVRFAEAERTGSTALPPDGPEGSDARVPLSELGRAQARVVGRWLAGLGPADRPQRVLCSPYVRALQTWEFMAAEVRATEVYEPPPALVDERLRDREMGTLELYSPLAVREHAPAEAARRERVGEWFYRPPGGESLADVTVRVRDLLTELHVAAAGQRVLVVAHDAVVVTVGHALAGLGSPVPPGRPVPNASLSRWDGDGGVLRPVAFGDTGHFRGTGDGGQPTISCT
ncbi:phosphoglycerate mutase [Streptomyces mashuensis]|uniref:Phosphoglycerate mutase n=1 Tax=Streptomyces mashuensis TaxID=33904 RepID=A0A919B5V8_9ACTN|nr:histidine phosphatase family protein [Streptomyces mashuensis]GHF55798.1 phosphoglycerate mutase [Streptomyces mashuensis]